MATKVKRLTVAGRQTDGQMVAAIKESANLIWLAGLGAFSKAQEEGTRFFDSLVKEGEEIQNRAKKTAGDTIADVRAKATGTWDKLEKVFEDRVAQALHSLNVPTKKDIDDLSRHVAELTAVTKKLSASVEAESGKSRRSAA
jgi:poly(hydroxyalkanoate) granule-associated protein